MAAGSAIREHAKTRRILAGFYGRPDLILLVGLTSIIVRKSLLAGTMEGVSRGRLGP
jgi:hypothetical protein